MKRNASSIESGSIEVEFGLEASIQQDVLDDGSQPSERVRKRDPSRMRRQPRKSYIKSRPNILASRPGVSRVPSKILCDKKKNNTNRQSDYDELLRTLSSGSSARNGTTLLDEVDSNEATTESSSSNVSCSTRRSDGSASGYSSCTSYSDLSPSVGSLSVPVSTLNPSGPNNIHKSRAHRNLTKDADHKRDQKRRAGNVSSSLPDLLDALATPPAKQKTRETPQKMDILQMEDRSLLSSSSFSSSSTSLTSAVTGPEPRRLHKVLDELIPTRRKVISASSRASSVRSNGGIRTRFPLWTMSSSSFSVATRPKTAKVKKVSHRPKEKYKKRSSRINAILKTVDSSDESSTSSTPNVTIPKNRSERGMMETIVESSNEGIEVINDTENLSVCDSDYATDDNLLLSSKIDENNGVSKTVPPFSKTLEEEFLMPSFDDASFIDSEMQSACESSLESGRWESKIQGHIERIIALTTKLDEVEDDDANKENDELDCMKSRRVSYNPNEKESLENNLLEKETLNVTTLEPRKPSAIHESRMIVPCQMKFNSADDVLEDLAKSISAPVDGIEDNAESVAETAVFSTQTSLSIKRINKFRGLTSALLNLFRPKLSIHSSKHSNVVATQIDLNTTIREPVYTDLNSTNDDNESTLNVSQQSSNNGESDINNALNCRNDEHNQTALTVIAVTSENLGPRSNLSSVPAPSNCMTNASHIIVDKNPSMTETKKNGIFMLRSLTFWAKRTQSAALEPLLSDAQRKDQHNVSNVQDVPRITERQRDENDALYPRFMNRNPSTKPNEKRNRNDEKRQIQSFVATISSVHSDGDNISRRLDKLTKPVSTESTAHDETSCTSDSADGNSLSTYNRVEYVKGEEESVSDNLLVVKMTRLEIPAAEV